MIPNSITLVEEDKGFQFSPVYASLIDKDPNLKEEIERRVNIEVERLLIEKSSSFQQQAVDEGQKKGFLEGVEQAKLQTALVYKKLEKIGQTLLDEKRSLLEKQSQVFLEVALSVFNKFLVPNKEKNLENLKSWVEEGLKDFTDSSRIQISLGKQDFEKFKASGLMIQGSKVEFKLDETLKSDELKCELNQGGFLFSHEKELERLKNIFGQVLNDAA